MKKTICLLFTVVAVTACLAMAACAQNQPVPEAVATAVSAQEGISDAAYCDLFSAFPYNSIEDLYQGLRDLDADELESVRFREDQQMEYTRQKTRVTEDELKDGIFGSMRNKLLKEDTLMVPYYQGKELPLDDEVGYSSITIYESQACRKPWINFRGKIGNEFIFFNTMYYDKTLMEEANEKGASWLMSQINPEGINVYNYKERQGSKAYNIETGQYESTTFTAYERVVRLGDRDVLAMVFEHIFENGKPLLEATLYFVYDDILVCAWRATPEFMEILLADITFREVSFSTNTPLREEPGRAGTPFSTRSAATGEKEPDNEE